MTDYLGRPERETARALIDALPEALAATMRWQDIDLRPSAEHVLYTALRRPPLPAARLRLEAIRPLARLGRAFTRSRRDCAGGRVELVALVTRSVHAQLFTPVAVRLEGMSRLVVDARTAGLSRQLDGTGCRLVDHLAARDIGSLWTHAAHIGRAWAAPPAEWAGHVDVPTAERLSGLLRRGLPIVALDGARVLALARRHAPRIVACFSESGPLSRIVPPVGHHLKIPVVDLPHGEANDPWGSAGMAYDGVAVYGPRAAAAMALAGVAPERVTIIGPLALDGLLARSASEAAPSRPRIVFASQPGDPTKAAVHPDMKREALRAAIRVAAAVGPADVIIVPHPNETDDIAADVLAAEPPPEGVSVRTERIRRLHDVLPDSLAMVTASSQSVFEAAVSGVPAITVNASGGPDPVTFAADGIAIGVTSAEEAGAVGIRLGDPDERRRAAEAARAALGDRLGPLDGRAAERAAAWLRSFVDGAGGAPAAEPGTAALESPR